MRQWLLVSYTAYVPLQLGPLIQQMIPVVEASPVYEMARNASGVATCATNSSSDVLSV